MRRSVVPKPLFLFVSGSSDFSVAAAAADGDGGGGGAVFLEPPRRPQPLLGDFIVAAGDWVWGDALVGFDGVPLGVVCFGGGGAPAAVAAAVEVEEDLLGGGGARTTGRGEEVR